jgi:hypothetical protein
MLGDEVGFNVANPDKVYASVIFKHNKHKIDGLRFYYPRAETISLFDVKPLYGFRRGKSVFLTYWKG